MNVVVVFQILLDDVVETLDRLHFLVNAFLRIAVRNHVVSKQQVMEAFFIQLSQDHFTCPIHNITIQYTQPIPILSQQQQQQQHLFTNSENTMMGDSKAMKSTYGCPQQKREKMNNLNNQNLALKKCAPSEFIPLTKEATVSAVTI